MKTLDVLITSASRLDLLKKTIQSFKKKAMCSLEYRFVLHEDVVIEKESDRVLEWANMSNIFDTVIVTKPAERLGKAIKKLLDEAQSKIIFRLEDDWEFEKEFNIDKMLEIFVDHKINQIMLNKRSNDSLVEVIGKNFKLTLCNEWGMAPALWRLSFIKPKWKSHPTGDGVNLDLKGYDKNTGGVLLRKNEWLIENMGAYWYGGNGETRYIKHLGHGRNMIHRPLDMS
jgi:hypothetical protein